MVLKFIDVVLKGNTFNYVEMEQKLNNWFNDTLLLLHHKFTGILPTSVMNFPFRLVTEMLFYDHHDTSPFPTRLQCYDFIKDLVYSPPLKKFISELKSRINTALDLIKMNKLVNILKELIL